MRLIDADALILDYVYDLDNNYVADLDDIRNMPTIDPVRHGKWEYAEDEVLDDLTFSAWKCSCCGYYAYKPGIWHYCPNCGARMEGDDNEAD